MKAARAVEIVKDTVKMRALPAEAKRTQAGSLQRFLDWFQINREPLGKIVLAASLLIRGMLWIPHHSEVADFLKGVVDTIALLGGMTFAAGRFKSDKGKLQDIHTELKRRSGQIPAVERRATE